MKTKRKLVLDLQENAIDSLTHAVEHFLGAGRTDLKQAVLNLYQSVCLFLKLRLHNEHPLLVFDRPEQAKDRDALTVGIKQTIGRLRAIDVVLDKSQAQALEDLRKHRNRLEHATCEIDSQEVETLIGQVVRFLEEFLLVELNIILKDQLDSSIYFTLSEAVYTYDERLERAKEAMGSWHPKHNPDHKEATCPECGNETVANSSEDSFGNEVVGCYFCGEEFYADECMKCGGFILRSRPTRRGDMSVCDCCFEYVMSRDD